MGQVSSCKIFVAWLVTLIGVLAMRTKKFRIFSAVFHSLDVLNCNVNVYISWTIPSIKKLVIQQFGEMNREVKKHIYFFVSELKDRN